MILYSARRHPSGVLVLAADTRYCDTGACHEVEILTDGRRVYAHGQTTGCPAASRYGSEITVTCGQPGRDDHACEGTVTVDLTDPDVWTAADNDRTDLLTRHGIEVDR